MASSIAGAGIPNDSTALFSAASLDIVELNGVRAQEASNPTDTIPINKTLFILMAISFLFTLSSFIIDARKLGKVPLPTLR
jgi:amino acid permease